MASVSSSVRSDLSIDSDNLGDYAYAAVRKHFKKSIQHEADVLVDSDPEPLHQMRVGMRRLRTTLKAYGLVLVLPDAASENSIKKLARILGQVRDLDVLMEKLETQYRPELEPKEQKQLDTVLKTLRKHRHKHFAKLQEKLSGKLYQQFVSAYKDWLKKPAYGELAACPMGLVLPDLLLPLISELMLHPGWLVGQTLAPDSTDAETLSRWLDEEGLVLHSLRKQIKQVRYQAEFFADFYGEAFAARIDEFKEMQELLGQIQDCWVLNQLLASIQGSNWAEDLPQLQQRLQQERLELWQQWYPIQHRYLDPVIRNELRQLLLEPSGLQQNGSPADNPNQQEPGSSAFLEVRNPIAQAESEPPAAEKSSEGLEQKKPSRIAKSAQGAGQQTGASSSKKASKKVPRSFPSADPSSNSTSNGHRSRS